MASGIIHTNGAPDYTGNYTVTANENIPISGKKATQDITVNVDTRLPEEVKAVELAMSSGNQIVTPSQGKTISQLTVNKPPTMLPENIKSGVNIGGIVGSLAAGGGIPNINNGGFIAISVPDVCFYIEVSTGDTPTSMNKLIDGRSQRLAILPYCPRYLSCYFDGSSPSNHNIRYWSLHSIHIGHDPTPITGISLENTVDLYSIPNAYINKNSILILMLTVNCFIEDTLITLADFSQKKVQDITYDDDLLVWNFYTSKFDSEKPRWIMTPQESFFYNKITFENGSVLGVVGPGKEGYHRIYNKEQGKFTRTGENITPNGTTTFAQNGEYTKIVSQETVYDFKKYYNILDGKHFNLFANGILAGYGLANAYKIEDMKYVGERLNSPEEVEQAFARLEKIKLKNTKALESKV